MRVSQRLLLTLLPAFVGLLTVVGLAYWGEYQRQAPHLAVLAAAVALGASVLLALRNARYLAQRIERLAGSEPRRAVDELDSIEQSVERLAADLAAARDGEARSKQAAAEERSELTTLLSSAAGTATTALDEIRLPLHILLENRFGDLNENQEEMLGAAQAAAEEASVLLRRLRLIADLERGAVELRRDLLRVDDIVRGLLPTLQSLGERREVRVVADVAPALPRVPADSTYLNEALSILLRNAVNRTADRGEVRITVQAHPGMVRVTSTSGSEEISPLDDALVRRLTRQMAIHVVKANGSIDIDLPVTPVNAGPEERSKSTIKF
jgi:signal transduction histidine kinase